jgi:hypothetical protein
VWSDLRGLDIKPHTHFQTMFGTGKETGSVVDLLDVLSLGSSSDTDPHDHRPLVPLLLTAISVIIIIVKEGKNKLLLKLKLFSILQCQLCSFCVSRFKFYAFSWCCDRHWSVLFNAKRSMFYKIKLNCFFFMSSN